MLSSVINVSLRQKIVENQTTEIDLSRPGSGTNYNPIATPFVIERYVDEYLNFSPERELSPIYFKGN